MPVEISTRRSGGISSRGRFPKHFLSSPLVYKSQICSELTSHIQTQVCDFPALMFFSLLPALFHLSSPEASQVFRE